MAPTCSPAPVCHTTVRPASPSRSRAAGPALQDPTALVGGALRRTPELSGCGISWYRDGDALVLRGRVRSFYQKQVAQTVVLHLDGFERIINELEVVGPPQRVRHASWFPIIG